MLYYPRLPAFGKVNQQVQQAHRRPIEDYDYLVNDWRIGDGEVIRKDYLDQLGNTR